MLAGTLLSLQPVSAARSTAGEAALKFLDNTAQKAGLNDAGYLGQDADSESKVLGLIADIINVILGMVGIVFFIQIFWAGTRWMTAGGNEEVIKESKNSIKAALIGIVIALSAFLITNFVMNQIGKVTTVEPITSNASAQGACGTTGADGRTDISGDCAEMTNAECASTPGFGEKPGVGFFVGNTCTALGYK